MATHAIGFTYSYGFKPGTGVNREDLLDMIHNIDPWDTPLFSMSPKSKAYHVYHEWPEDTLNATSTAGAAEGADFTLGTNTKPARVVNWCQIFRADTQITNTQLSVNPAGIADTYRYQISKSLKEIKRNIEVSLLGASGATATGATGTTRIMKRVADFVQTNAFHCDSASVGGTGATASAHSLQEFQFNGLLQVIYQAGGNPMDVYVSPPVKRVISSFTGTNYQQAVIPSTDRTLIRSIDVYVSDFGTQYIHLDRWVPTATSTAANADTGNTGHIYCLDRTRCRVAFLRTPKHVPIASLGDSVRGMVLTELTLEMFNEKGHGRMYGLRND